MEPDRRSAELLFQVLTERGETNSVAIASNESFSGSVSVKSNETLMVSCFGAGSRDR